MSAYTLQEIRDAYMQKKSWEKQFPINYYIVRPLSFFLTHVILKITTNPARVAAWGFIIGLLGLISLSCTLIFSLWPGIIFIILYSISDAVDGNIARTTSNVTLFGIYLDGLLGEFIDGNYFFFLGLGCYLAGTSINDPMISQLGRDYARALPLFLGAWIIICRLWSSNFESRYQTFRIKKEGLAPLDNSQIYKTIGKSSLSNRWYYLLFINIECLNNQLLLLVLLTALDLETWFLLIFALFYSTKAIVFFFLYLRMARSTLINR
jgi:phosphatidylglycerophosphate synthase